MTRPRSEPRTTSLAPRVAILALALTSPLTVLALATLAQACGGEPATDAAAPAEPAKPGAIDTQAGAIAHAGEQRAAQARGRVDALLAEPTPATLLAVLAQGHAEARALLGPHNLRYKASFALTPEIATRPVVDEPIQQEQRVVDE
ncbi:MAG TPA: hypothetical protein VGB85_20635, partial [Nannocystis sp.]